jgi:chitin disaccharide deacetylase
MSNNSGNIRNEEKIRLIVRADDMGMTHACNMAVEKCFEEGILTCAAIQPAAPWAQEAATMVKNHPEWCIGAHLTPLGEWVGYRWRPVLPYDKVPSIVDENGFLHQTIQGFYSKQIDYDQLEKEFLAQVDLVANKWGVKLGYIDYHYIGGIEPDDRNYREVLQRVANAYGQPLSSHLNEKMVKGIFRVEPTKKEETLVQRLKELTPGLWLLVDHLLLDCLESQALVYGNPSDFVEGGVGNHRAAETNALLSKKVRKAVDDMNIELVDYRDII